MASGAVHERYLRWAWRIAVPIGIILYFIFDYNFLYPALFYFNYLLTEISSPDIDHLVINKDEADAKRFFKAISPALLIPNRFKRIKSFLSHINLGIVGAFYVAWSQIYEYFSSVFGGHRSWFSHGLVIGTITRMAWFNTPFAYTMFTMVNHAIANWGTPPWSVVGFNFFWMNVWLKPYLVTQFLAWLLGDINHLILDTEIAKGRLYGFDKFGDKRSLLLKKIIDKDWADGKRRK